MIARVYLTIFALALACTPAAQADPSRPPASSSGVASVEAPRSRGPSGSASPPAPGDQGWAGSFPSVQADVRRGAPLVTFVVVPLCDNQQIDCGSTAAGAPGRLETNLYWGAIFGARRFFERKASVWTRVELTQGAPPFLERTIYRRSAPGAPWGTTQPIEQLVVFQAVHGASIDEAVRRFWALATEGGRVVFQDGDRRRDERIHVAGYAGHNRLMDGLALPPAPAVKAAIPSFVLACYSERYFAPALGAAGSDLLLSMRALMAPEGYLIDGLARALGDNEPRSAVRSRTVAAYAKWQRLSIGTASPMFSPAR